MASSVIQRFSGVSHAALYSQRASRRSGGTYEYAVNISPQSSRSGKTRGSQSFFQIPMDAAYPAEGFFSSGFIGTTTGVHAGSFAASLSHTRGAGGSFSSANRRLHGKKICLIQGSQHHSTRLCADE